MKKGDLVRLEDTDTVMRIVAIDKVEIFGKWHVLYELEKQEGEMEHQVSIGDYLIPVKEVSHEVC